MGASGNIPSQLLVFELGKRSYAVDVNRVKRIIPTTSCSVVPKSPPWLLGLISHRNHIVPVYDLVGAAGEPERSVSIEDFSHTIVFEDHDRELVALAVGSVVGVREASFAELAEEQPAPRALTCGLQATSALQLAPKEPPIILVEDVRNVQGYVS